MPHSSFEELPPKKRRSLQSAPWHLPFARAPTWWPAQMLCGLETGDTGRIAEGMIHARRAAHHYCLQQNHQREFRSLLTLFSLGHQAGDYAVIAAISTRRWAGRRRGCVSRKAVAFIGSGSTRTGS